MKITYQQNPLKLKHVSTCCNIMKNLIGGVMDSISIISNGLDENKSDGFHTSIELRYFDDKGKSWIHTPLVISYCPFCGAKIEFENINN